MKEDKTIIIIVSIFVILILGIIAVNWDNITGNVVEEQQVPIAQPRYQAKVLYEPEVYSFPDNSVNLVPGGTIDIIPGTPVTLELYLKTSITNVIGFTFDFEGLGICTGTFNVGSNVRTAFNEGGSGRTAAVSNDNIANLDAFATGANPVVTLICTPPSVGEYNIDALIGGAMSIVYRQANTNYEQTLDFNGATTLNAGTVFEDKIVLEQTGENTFNLKYQSSKPNVLGFTGDFIGLNGCSHSSLVGSGFRIAFNEGGSGRIAAVSNDNLGTLPATFLTLVCSNVPTRLPGGAMDIVYRLADVNYEVPVTLDIDLMSSGSGGGSSGGGDVSGGGSSGGGGAPRTVTTTVAPAPIPSEERVGGPGGSVTPVVQPQLIEEPVEQEGFWGNAISWFSAATPIGWVIIGVLLVIVLAVIFLSKKPEPKRPTKLRKF